MTHNHNTTQHAQKQISKPTKVVRKFLMARAHGKTENKDNRFFIDIKTGELKGSVYIQGNGGYVAHIPTNTYEVSVGYEPFLSYITLDEYIDFGIDMIKMDI